MRYWIAERLETRSVEQLRRIRERAVRLRRHPRQLRSSAYEAALREFDAYVAGRANSLHAPRPSLSLVSTPRT